MVRHSDDHGRTWTPTRVLRRHEEPAVDAVASGDVDAGAGRAAAPRGFGDASLLVDPASGRVLCWHVASTGRSFFSADAGPGGAGLELWLSASDDDGDTWTHRDLTASLKPADVTGMFAASGNGATIALPGGGVRLLQPFVLRTAGEEPQHWVAVARSDDGGDTWALGARVGPDCDESKVAATSDGRVLLHARATPRRRQAWSSDAGVTFTAPAPHPALVDPACNGGLCAVGDLVVCSLLDDPTARRRLALRTSRDAGATWSDAVVVDAGAAGYSVVAPLADGSLGLAWERGDYAAIAFVRLDPADIGLAGGVGTIAALPPTPGAARPPEVAGPRRASCPRMGP